ncbi:hypothetical protein FQA39_LY08628 [Lamprigera yunnana]|nr:hypothetical protein FQA39_LY08628 [Lamprigera yunnana]
MKWSFALIFFIGIVYCDNKLLDLQNLPDLSKLPDIEDVVKDKCRQNGGEKAFSHLKDVALEFKNYVAKNFQPDIIEKEIEAKSKTGSLDEVFKKYCDLKPEILKYAHKVGNAVVDCLANDEKPTFKLAENITEGLLDFICDKDGERIALFIVEDGFTCFTSKSEALKKCNYGPVGHHNISSLDEVPSFKVTKEGCNNYKKLQECVLETLEQCTLGYDILATGGGPSKKPTLDPVLQVVEDAASSLDVSITCPWHSTALLEIADTERKCIPLLLLSSHSDEFAPSFETPTAMSKSRNRRSIAVASVSKEKDARVQKLHQATEQQELLFNLQKQILEEELQRAVEERAAAKKKAELEFQNAAEILDQKLKKEIEERAALKKKSESQVRQATAECELALLKLRSKLKETVNILICGEKSY